jgi:hypothetical protein
LLFCCCFLLLLQILSVLSVLAQRYTANLLTRPQLLQLQQAVADLPAWLWCYNKQRWVGLDDDPAVADDADMAAVMAVVGGVHLVQLEGVLLSAGNAQGSRAGGGPAAVKQLQQLLQLLGVPPLSSSVSVDVAYEELTSWDEMAQRVADALLLAQRWCWHSKPRQEYDAIAGVWFCENALLPFGSAVCRACFTPCKPRQGYDAIAGALKLCCIDAKVSLLHLGRVVWCASCASCAAPGPSLHGLH